MVRIRHLSRCPNGLVPTRAKVQVAEIFGAEAYGSLLGMEGSVTGQEIREKCNVALTDVGASRDFCDFFAEVLQCEFEMNATLHRLHQTLGVDRMDGIGSDPDKLLRISQELTRSFNSWRGQIEELHERSSKVPPFYVDPTKIGTSTVLKALCSLQTNELVINEGDDIFITDTSQADRLKVKNSQGQEGYIPVLCCVLPSPDRNALTATERLRIQLLASWVESVKKLRRLMMECLLTTAKLLTNNWRCRVTTGNLVPKERVARRFRRLTDTITKQAPRWDLTKLHSALFSLEKEIGSWNMNDVGDMVEVIAALDKSVLCYQMFTKQLHLFRHTLEKSHRPIRIVEHMGQLSTTKKGKTIKYYELKMTVEETETVEEVTEVISTGSDAMGPKNETVTADQITSSSQAAETRFVIRCVMDPRSGLELSIQEAIDNGIVIQETGTYINPDTGISMSIPEAMTTGKIKVEQMTTTKSQEEIKAIGLITIKTTVDNRQYTIRGVVDAKTGRQLTTEEATKAGLLNEQEGFYKNHETDEQMTLDDAIQEGYLLVDYEEEEPDEVEYETKIFAVSAVVDQKNKKRVPFFDAVKKGLIDKETGTYINNLTGQRMYVVDAIRKGFLKAKEVEDTAGLDIDAENRVVIERMDRIRKNVLKPMGILSALRNAAANISQ